MSTNKAVFITGITGGLGGALARRFHEKNYVVAGFGGPTKERTELAKLPEGIEVDHLDIRNFVQVDRWFAKAIASVGMPRYILHCAGVIHKQALVKETPYPIFESCLSVNLIGTFNVCKAAVSRCDGTAACLVNFSSGWGKKGRHGLSPYSASKFGVEGLTQSLAGEVVPPFKVFTLDPGGGVQTEMLKTCLPNDYHKYPAPDDWAYLAYEFITQILPSRPSGSALTIDTSSL